MIFGSICSGIEAASVAWHPLGWRAAFLSEIEAFPRAVLSHHYPTVPLHGDFTTIEADQYEPIDLLVGGTPCQDFSVAGLRAGMAGDRGNLTLQFLTLARRLRPRWVVWENVPGVLSSNGGRDFGSFLGGLGELGYGWAYRTLDAQHFGVPQRRRRIFAVGYLGDWRPAGAVLFERHSMSGDSAPRRETRERTSSFTPGSIGGYREGVGTLRAHGGDYGGGTETLIAKCLSASHTASHTASGRQDPSGETYVVGTLVANGKAAGSATSQDAESGLLVYSIMPQNSGKDYKAREVNVAQPIMAGGPVGGNQGDDYIVQPVAMNLRGRDGGAMAEMAEMASLRAASGGSSRSYVAFQAADYTNGTYEQEATAQALTTSADRSRADPIALDLRNALRDPDKLDEMNRQGCGIGDDISHTLSVGAQHGVSHGSAVRRLTPRECERLQGFPDDYTLVPHRGKPAADGPRYKALGNSMAVPCMAWIGHRIEAVNAILTQRSAAA